MDLTTHALTGAMIALAPRKGRKLARAGALAAACLPDIDALPAWAGGWAMDLSRFLRWHRGPGHSLLGALLMGLVLAAICYRPSRDRQIARQGLLFGLAGAGSHLFLDWIDPLGAALLWPLSDQRFSAPLLLPGNRTAWLLLGLPAAFVVVRRLRHLAPRAALGLFGSFLALLTVEKRGAESMLSSSLVDLGIRPTLQDTFPTPRPRDWRGLAAWEGGVVRCELSLQAKRAHCRELARPNGNGYEEAARSDEGRLFLRSTPFAWAEEQAGEGFRSVKLYDLRYGDPGEGSALTLTVRLDPQDRARKDSF